MECDWEVELGPDSPVIDASWDGYIDLRRMPGRISQISEAVQLSALHDALIRLNSSLSSVSTAKCDVWIPESFDHDELDASPDAAAFGLAGYIDLIPMDAHVAAALDAVVDWCKRLCLCLRPQPLRCCRMDAIVRRAAITSEIDGFGVTIYVSACGPSPQEASKALSVAITALTDAVMAVGASSQPASKYNRSTKGE